MKIIVLGSGLVGSVIAADLAANEGFKVSVADIDGNALEKLSARCNATTLKFDLSDTNRVSELVSGYDLVVSAVPGFLGHQTLKSIIEAGKNLVDITFAAEDFLKFDALAKEKGVTAICDFGVAPGMSNLLSAYLAGKLDKAEKIAIYVGGLPKVRQWPFEYKAVFSPSDLVEEYTRPARFVVNGQQVVKPALTDLEIINFERVGSLEAFNSDGLRSLLTTLDVPDMVEKTLRYPGHIHKVEVLRDAGFFSEKPLNINGQMVKPVDVTAKLLFPKLDLENGEQDITVMRVEAIGEKAGRKTRLRYDLFDSYDIKTEVHSMGRTTGYAATMAVQILAEGRFREPGVIAPEMLANDENLVQFILKGLAEKGVEYKFSEKEI